MLIAALAPLVPACAERQVADLDLAVDAVVRGVLDDDAWASRQAATSLAPIIVVIDVDNVSASSLGRVWQEDGLPLEVSSEMSPAGGGGNPQLTISRETPGSGSPWPITFSVGIRSRDGGVVIESWRVSSSWFGLQSVRSSRMYVHY